MKILKEKSREYGGKAYYKYKINIPTSILSTAELKAGDEIDVETKKDEIILRKKKN
ncbi:MAG: AbrB/MazE/SpoVT family DNA-binding domain-containing protein [Nanoarchaeota archaeon]